MLFQRVTPTLSLYYFLFITQMISVVALKYCCIPDNYWINYGLHVPPPTAISFCYLWAETDCMYFLCCSVEIVIINNTK